MEYISSKSIQGLDGDEHFDVVKQDFRYVVRDSTFLDGLTLSTTFLAAQKSTSGHLHAGQEELYFFIKGSGQMQINDQFIGVDQGDIICVEGGEFHKVYNTADEGLLFACVFSGKRQKWQ